MNNQSQFNSIERISLGINNTEANNDSSKGMISDDGRYVTFVSKANNLVLGDTNRYPDIFVYDRTDKTTERISVNSNGVQANSFSQDPVISSNGRYTAFTSDASNLVPNDLNKNTDIFVDDRQQKTTERISVDSNGIEADSYSFAASISDDGRYVVFESDAEKLIPEDNNHSRDVFIHDRNNKTTELVSQTIDKTVANNRSQDASISQDSRYIAFESDADNLIPNDINDDTDIFVYDRQKNITEIISVASDKTIGNAYSFNPSISDDGRYVVFESRASNLVPNDTNRKLDIFIRDRALQTTKRIIVNNIQGNDDSFNPSISDDGRYVVFESKASNLVPNDTNNLKDQFLFDLLQGTIERVNVAADGIQANNKSDTSSINADGQYITFGSGADNLVAGDTNNAVDIFVRKNDQTEDNLLNNLDLSHFHTERVQRFYEFNRGNHFYTSDAREAETIRTKSKAGELSYQDEGVKFNVLADNLDALTGETLTGVRPIYRFFNTGTGSHLYTMDENEKSFIQENLDNYNFEGVKYYAFESEPENIATIPVYRLLNNTSGSHLFTVDRNEVNYIQENLPYFSLENNGDAAFHVFEL